MIKKILKLLIILIISIIIGNTIYGIYTELKLSDSPKSSNNLSNTVLELMSARNITNYQNVENNNNQSYNKAETVPVLYQGYKVSSKLEIPKINLATYVLDEKSDEAMWVCPTKYYGPEPNGVGNYCIAAHNYNKQNMFNHIIELQIGDSIYLTDNNFGKLEYVVYDVYKALPSNTEPLTQETNGHREITLITCSDYSSKRIIVKARLK